MPTPLRRRIRLARRGGVYAVGITLVLLALVIAVASQLLPLVEQHPAELARWLGQRAGRTVAFDRVETGWTRRGPLLQLHNLRLGDGDQAVAVGDAEMLVSMYAGLLPGVPLSELRLRGLDLTLERSADGRWQVRGLPGQELADGDPFHALEGLGELQVIDGALTVVAPELGVDLRVPRIDLRLRVQGDRVRAGMRAWPLTQTIGATAAAPMRAALDFDRVRGDGRLYASVDGAELQPLASVLALHGITLQGGRGQAKAWVALDDNRVVDVRLDTTLEQLVLAGSTIAAVPGGAGQIPIRGIERLQGRMHWQRTGAGWRLDAPLLRLDMQDQQYRLDRLTLAAGQHYALVADHLDVEPLAALAVLSNRVPAALRHWLLQARPHASVSMLDMQGRRGGGVRGSARIDGLGFLPIGDGPGLEGVAADVQGDADGFSARLDPARAVRFDWPSGFGVEHVVQLTGDVTGWRGSGGWQTGTSGLRIAGPDFGASVRGGLGWNGDGGRPRIDIVATVDPARLPVAKGFWVRHIMPEGLLHWLDTALVDGLVSEGQAIVSGDLDDWPFADNTGHFEASARISGATLAFQPGWPAATGLDLHARFLGNSLDITGHGMLAGITIPRINATVDDYHEGTLAIDAKGSSDVARLLELLRASPLQRLDPATFASIKGSGPAEVAFAMALPLHHEGELAIEGNVSLGGVRLADSRWNLAFDQVRGPVRYSAHGFRAEQLDVRMDGLPGKLSMRSGEDAVRDTRNVLEAELEAVFGPDALLQHAPELAWLSPYLRGKSAWTVGVVIPSAAAGDGRAAHLKLRSTLAGTALLLPAPLDKAAHRALATTVEVPLPLGSGDVAVSMGEVLALRARKSGSSTGIRVALGSGEVTEAPPASGLIASGHAPTLDAIGWVGLAVGGDGGGDSGLTLRRIDVRTDRLRLLGAEFIDARLRVSPETAGALAVQVDGPMLQGRLRLPAARSGTVSGRFERVHWRLPARPTTGPVRARAAAVARVVPAGNEDAIDPSRIPPLALAIDELRVAEALLGTASLRTRATAGGMQLEHFRAAASGQRIDAQGSWTGRGAAARTRLQIDLAGTDFGGLLAGLGHVGRLSGGDGKVTLTAQWPGGPMDFELVNVAGNLAGEVRDGRLLEVDPGAGRVLGLLSVAELPRRLMLDFRDFFAKGFAFNRASGDIRIANGLASSSDLRIEGPAARINIRGEADLRAETFNQTIEVLPRSGNLLAVAGALAGGPVGAAIGAAASAVLQKPLGQIGAKTYRVSGPWKDPQVDVISREAERASPPRVPPAGPVPTAPAAARQSAPQSAPPSGPPAQPPPRPAAG